MRFIAAALLAGMFGPVALAGVGIVSEQLVHTAEGRLDSMYPSGSAPPPDPIPLQFSGLVGGLNGAGIQNIVCASPAFSHNARQYLTGTESGTATITITSPTGDDPTASGWTAPSTGNTLAYSCADTIASGTFVLTATGSGSSDTSAVIAWSATSPAPPGESGYDFPQSALSTSSNALTAVPTFHNVGLYWKETANNTTNEALVKYCKVSTGVCKQGLSLWWDNRSQGSSTATASGPTIPYGFKEARGSIVGLEPNTTYNVSVQTETGRIRATTQFTTWNETFAIASTVTPSASSSSTLTINSGGSASTGYVRYWRSGGWTIDGNFGINSAVVVNASYVIIDDLTCVDVDEFCVQLGANAHHVVIQNSDFSNMGTQDPNAVPFACNGSGGIGGPSGENFNITNLVIQNNIFHEPAFDANSWEEGRPSTACGAGTNDSHPAGSAPIQLNNTGGNHVIRYNEVWSTLTKMWKDGISGQQNFSTNGDLRRDTDVYRNEFSHIWDDVIQNEGANMNNRVYENFSRLGKVCHARATVSIGPAYIFRNVCTEGINAPGDLGGEGKFLKTRTKPNSCTLSTCTLGLGALYVINNSAYRASSGTGIGGPVQIDEGASHNLFFWNNIMDTPNGISSGNRAWIDANSNFSDNLYATGQTKPSSDTAGQVATPTYDSGHASGPYTPATNSPALDAATIYPNFSDVYSGSGPDRGAVERGQTAVIYGNQ